MQQWAVKYNVAVLICIHAAKGSQNGNDNSAPPVSGQVYWSQYQENIDNTVEVARFLAARYKNVPSFFGVELLNEPTSVDVNILKQLHQRLQRHPEHGQKLHIGHFANSLGAERGYGQPLGKLYGDTGLHERVV